MKPIRLPLAALALFCETQAEAKTLGYCLEGSPATLSPALAVSNIDNTASADPMFDGLTRIEPGRLQVVPWLAEGWELSDDGLTYTFRLREGVEFHRTPHFTPSRHLNADDVLFTFERMWRADHPYHAVSGGDYFNFDALGIAGLLRAIEKVDGRTIRFRLTQPDASFPAQMGSPNMVIYSAEYAGQLTAAGTPERIDRDPVGTGPFQLVAYARDAQIRYRAHPGYWNGRPAIDDLVFAITPDPAVRLQKLKAGECHVMPYPTPADVAVIRADPRLVLLDIPGLDFGYFAFNTERPPFGDRRVRRAIAMAIDRRAIMDVVFLGVAGRPATNPTPPTLWGHADATEPFLHEPEEARRLLAEAGHAGGFSATLWAMPVTRAYNPNARRMAELIQADLARVGIEARIVSYDNAEYIKRSRAGEHDMILLGWIADYPDPDQLLGQIWTCAALKERSSNWARWCNEAFDAKVLAAKRAGDQEERARLYREAQAIFHAEVPAVPIAHSVLFMALRREVTGYVISSMGRQFFHKVDLRD